MNQKICFELEHIAEPGGRAFRIDTPHGHQGGFVIRIAGQVRAYLNSCPHTGVSLNWADDQFIDMENKHIQCSLHGALFEPLEGRCIWGPCVGEYLQSLTIELVDQRVIIYI